jgi:hypothetical protein
MSPEMLEATLIMYAAAVEPIGLLLQVSDPTRAKQRLYQARAKAGDEALAGLQIRTVGLPDGNLAICHREVQIGGTDDNS